MRTILCEDCFPAWRNFEVYCTIPLNPCDECGRHASYVKAHIFPDDPRPLEEQVKYVAKS